MKQQARHIYFGVSLLDGSGTIARYVTKWSFNRD